MTAFVLSLGWPFFVRITGPAYARWAGGVEIALAVAFLAAELRATIHERTFAD